MNALLLSAGEGTRLRPLTLETPKCLLPLVNDEPILKYWIDTLIKIGIDEIFIDTYWLKDKIREYVNTLNENIKSRVFLYEETHLEPVGEVLAKLNCCLGKRFLVVNSDTYVERNEVSRFIEMANFYRQSQIPICLAVEKREDTKGKGVVIFFSDKKRRLIKDFIEKPENNHPGYVWAGMALMGRDVIESYRIEELIRKELSRDIFPDFKNRMIGLEIKEAIDIGESVDAYRRVYQRFNQITNLGRVHPVPTILI